MAEETTGEKGFKLTSKETGEFVSYLIAHECTPAKTLVAEECTIEEAQAWIDEQAAAAEKEREAVERD